MMNLLTHHIARTLTFAALAVTLFAVSTALVSISAAAQEAPETVVFDLEKKFSGPVPDGYTADQFSFQVDGVSATGTTISETVSLTEHTGDSANAADGTVELPEGTYTLSEIGPDGFVPEEWRVQWTGPGCEDETAPSTVITVDENDLGIGNFGCRADNQWFPDDATDDDDDDDDGGDDDNGDGGNGGNGGNGEDDTYRIEGYVWHDDNENSEWDGFGEEGPSEDSQTGWEVKITNGTDTFATTTDESGFYYFEVPAGTWTITEVIQDGWTLIAPASGSHVVTVPAETAQSFVERVFAFLVPSSHAATLDTFGPFNFGNNQSSGGNGYSQGSYGGGGGPPDPRCDAFTLASSGGDDILEWETSRGDDLRITEDGTEIFTTGDDTVVDQGSHNLGTAAAALYELEVTEGNDGDTCEVDNRDGGGGGGGNASGSGGGAAEPAPEVLGEQVSVVPAGAPQTGAGGAAPSMPVLMTALFALIAALGTIFATRRHGA